MLLKKNFKPLLLHLLFVVSLFATACSSSKTEEQAIKEVAENWGTVTEVSKGAFTSTESGSGKYFEIEITNPALFAPESDHNLIVGGIAWSLYKNFSEEERKNYTRYDIVLNDSSDREITYNLPATQVKLFFEQQRIAQAYLKKLLEGDYAFIDRNYIPIKQIGADSLKTIFDPLLQAAGKTGKLEIYSAKQDEATLPDSSKIEVVSFQGVLVGGNKECLFLIALDPLKKSHNIVRIGYSN